MHKVDAPGATPSGEFTDGDPIAGVARTVLGARWHNTVQRELVAVVQAAGLELSDSDDSQVLQALGILSTPDRNLAINGGMSIWSRGDLFGGVSVPMPGGTERFLADRWHWTFPTGTTGASHARRPRFDPGHDQVLNPPEYYMRVWWTNSIAMPTPPHLRTRIEGVLPFSASPVTVSFWARADETFLGDEVVVEVVFTRRYASGGAEHEVVFESEITLAGGGVWAKYELTAQLSSLLGKNVGTPVTGPDVGAFEVMLRFPSTQNAGINITAFKVELSDHATPFEVRPHTLERLLCARYYEQSAPHLFYPDSQSLVGNAFTREATPEGLLYGLNTRFRVEKAYQPTVTWYSPVSGLADRIYYGGADRVVVGTNFPNTAATGVPEISHTEASALVGRAHWAAEAEI